MSDARPLPDTTYVNRAGKHCPRCQAPMWITNEDGKTIELLECVQCIFPGGLSAPRIPQLSPDALKPEPIPDDYHPSRLEYFVTAVLSARILHIVGGSASPAQLNDQMMIEATRCASRLMDEIDHVQMLRDTSAQHNAAVEKLESGK